MCGIIGQVNFIGSDLHRPALDSIQHRGPDGRGEWTSPEGDVYLGHTRLAIIDLTSTGHQPMSDLSKRFTITFNGEIYNHIELRNLLPRISWRGTSRAGSA